MADNLPLLNPLILSPNPVGQSRVVFKKDIIRSRGPLATLGRLQLHCECFNPNRSVPRGDCLLSARDGIFNNAQSSSCRARLRNGEVYTPSLECLNPAIKVLGRQWQR